MSGINRTEASIQIALSRILEGWEYDFEKKDWVRL